MGSIILHQGACEGKATGCGEGSGTKRSVLTTWLEWVSRKQLTTLEPTVCPCRTPGCSPAYLGPWLKTVCLQPPWLM